MDNSRRRDHAPTPTNHATTNLLETSSGVRKLDFIRIRVHRWEERIANRSEWKTMIKNNCLDKWCTARPVINNRTIPFGFARGKRRISCTFLPSFQSRDVIFSLTDVSRQQSYKFEEYRAGRRALPAFLQIEILNRSRISLLMFL